MVLKSCGVPYCAASVLSPGRSTGVELDHYPAAPSTCHHRSMWWGFAIGVTVGSAWFLALLLLPVDRLPLLNGSVFVVLGSALLALVILLRTGVLSSPAMSPPLPLVLLAVVTSLLWIYRGVLRIRDGRPDRQPPSRLR